MEDWEGENRQQVEHRHGQVGRREQRNIGMGRRKEKIGTILLAKLLKWHEEEMPFVRR